MEGIDKKDKLKPLGGASLFKNIEIIKQIIYYKFDKLLYKILFVNILQMIYTAALCTGFLYWPVVVLFTLKSTFFHLVKAVTCYLYTPRN